MASTRIDGKRTPELLFERISIGDGVGEDLAQKTREAYAQKIGHIANKIRSAGQGGLTPNNLAEHIKEVVAEKKMAQSSVRHLKAAAIFWIAEEAQNVVAQGGDVSDYEMAYQAIRQLSTKEMPARTKKTSSTKLKFFPKAALDSLVDYAEKTPNAKLAGTLVAFVRANLLVGLRPAEWFGATFMTYLLPNEKGSCIALRVENAKATHGRGNGSHREILLHGISDENLAALMHFQEITRTFAERFAHTTPRDAIIQAFFKPLQRAMNYALNRLGHEKDQLPTTYSTRHQAVANAKRSGLSDREIAAMFGHSSTLTAKSHYGKKMNGWMKVSFRPSPESIAAVPERVSHADLATPTKETMSAAAEWNHNQQRLTQ